MSDDKKDTIQQAGQRLFVAEYAYGRGLIQFEIVERFRREYEMMLASFPNPNSASEGRRPAKIGDGAKGAPARKVRRR